MTWLKKVGTIALKCAQVFMGIEPIAASLLGGSGNATAVTISKDLTEIANAVIAAEIMGQAINAPGAQKLQMAAPQIAQIILSSTLVAGKKIAKPDDFKAVCGRIGGDIADLMNCFDDNVKTV